MNSKCRSSVLASPIQTESHPNCNLQPLSYPCLLLLYPKNIQKQCSHCCEFQHHEQLNDELHSSNIRHTLRRSSVKKPFRSPIQLQTRHSSTHSHFYKIRLHGGNSLKSINQSNINIIHFHFN